MKKIYYVGMHDVLRSGKQIRSYSLAAAKKMDYLCTVANNLGFEVEIISPSYIGLQKYPLTKQSTEKIENGISLTLPTSWGAKNKISRICRVLLSRAWLFFYLLSHCKKDQPVLVYHNYEIAVPVCLAQKIKKFNLILEIEEQYSMVWNLTSWQKIKEKMLLSYGTEGSVVVSELLAEKLSIQKPVISYGNYNAYQGNIPQKSTNRYITLVYTGSIDCVKNSAFIALKMMPFLSNKYNLRISGSIAKGDEDSFFGLLEKVNEQCGRITCKYMGILDDKSYKELLLSADIALNPQKKGDFGEFLFPSKILTYMSYGLPVVSTKGASIVKSQVADLIIFADDFSPESVANAVQKVQSRGSKVYIDRIKQLNQKFSKQFINLLGPGV